jgi:hypothetical protein
MKIQRNRTWKWIDCFAFFWSSLKYHLIKHIRYSSAQFHCTQVRLRFLSKGFWCCSFRTSFGSKIQHIPKTSKTCKLGWSPQKSEISLFSDFLVQNRTENLWSFDKKDCLDRTVKKSEIHSTLRKNSFVWIWTVGVHRSRENNKSV